MSEDRTQAPSKRRREEARARGMVARSPELTAAIGLLAGVAMLGAWGGSLASACVHLIRSPFVFPSPGDADAVAALIRVSALHVAAPLLWIVGGVVLAMIAAHQAQVGGMWATGLIAPDANRLWSPSSDWSAHASRGAWGIVKAVVLVGVAAWAIRGEWDSLIRLSQQESAAIASIASAILRRMLFAMGIATLALGAVDYLLARGRIEAMLRTTPEESREDAKAVDGDPAVRARRLSLAKSWKADPGEVLKGAILIVTGPSGLAVVLGGEGPPGKVTVRAASRGASGAILKKSAKNAGLAVVESPALANHFASPSARTQALPEVLGRALAEAWPSPG